MGLSKSLSKEERAIPLIHSSQDIHQLISDKPVSVILTNIQIKGILVKTYYLQLSFVYGFKPSQKILVKASSKYLSFIKKFKNHSIFRENDTSKEYSLLPLPKGSLFIGNKSFGFWNYSNSGRRYWKFFRAYKRIVKELGLNKENLDFKNYRKILVYKNNPKVYLTEFKPETADFPLLKTKNIFLLNLKDTKKTFAYLWSFPHWSTKQRILELKGLK